MNWRLKLTLLVLLALIVPWTNKLHPRKPYGFQLGFDEQWGLFYNPNGLSTITYPIALSSKPWAIITTEGDPAGWNTSNGIAIAGCDIETASNTQANILSKWVLNGGTIKQGGQTIRALIIGI